MEDKIKQLREQAEKILKESTSQKHDIPISEFNRIIHDLKVYQIELELQNEELRNTQKQLVESRNRFAQLYNQTPAGYVTLNQNSIILQANQTFADMVNVDSSQIVNLSLADFFIDEDRSIFLSRFNAFFKKPIEKSMELKMTKKGGKPIFVRITGSLKTEGIFETQADSQQAKLFLIIYDITKQKITEELLVESEYRYRTLADSGQALIWTSGTDKLCNYFNKVWLTFTGRSLEMELGNGWTEGVHPNDIDRCIETYNTAFDKREPFEMEYRLRNAIGEYIWIMDKGTPNYNFKGEFIGYLGHCFDISEIKEAEDRIRVKNQELINLNAEKDKFFSIIAHDLRSPFNSFLGLTQIMAEDLNSMEMTEIQLFAISLSKSATNLYGLLENLLEWSGLQRGITGFNPESFSLHPKVVEIMSSVLESANNKGIQVEIIVPDDLKIFADEKMLGSIIRNLASNAIKFTHKGGEIILQARPVNDDIVEISISDSGIGMKNELLDKLFQLNPHSSRIGTDGEPSTGLGLIISKDFIEKHGGLIWAESEEGKGSTFYFTFPSKEFRKLENCSLNSRN
jgi:two-component system CheB/CheR fusion protein